MASLYVSQLEPEVVKALKERARRHHRSTEAEHRALIREVLLPPPLDEHLLKVPQASDEAHDDALERVQDQEAGDVFS